MEMGYALHLNKLKSSTPKNDLCQVWLKLAQWLWRRRFLNDPIPFLHFSDYLPFEEDLALYLKKLEFPLLVLKKIFKNVQCIFTLSLLSPLVKR
jgi:hypothetical protein